MIHLVIDKNSDFTVLNKTLPEVKTEIQTQTEDANNEFFDQSSNVQTLRSINQKCKLAEKYYAICVLEQLIEKNLLLHNKRPKSIVYNVESYILTDVYDLRSVIPIDIDIDGLAKNISMYLPTYLIETIRADHNIYFRTILKQLDAYSYPIGHLIVYRTRHRFFF